MNYEQMNNNVVTLTGKITTKPTYSHHVFGEGFHETSIEVSRLSEQTDVIPITISERLMQDNKVKEGSVVSLEGQFRSYNKIVDGRSKLMLTVFVRDITECDPDKNPNEIELTGYICKEPIYRTTPFKREICDILLAVNRAYNKSDYIPCIAWGRNARFVKSVGIGQRVSVLGRIQSRNYQKMREGGEYETRTAYEISINRIGLDDEVDNESEVNYN
jgi:single-stranded DNA-binding protein